MLPSVELDFWSAADMMLLVGRELPRLGKRILFESCVMNGQGFGRGYERGDSYLLNCISCPKVLQSKRTPSYSSVVVIKTIGYE